jgi:hypothetical protein
VSYLCGGIPRRQWGEHNAVQMDDHVMGEAAPKPSFQERVDNVFGFLGTTGGWALSDQQSINPGRDADIDSSDDDDSEDDAAAAAPAPAPAEDGSDAASSDAEPEEEEEEAGVPAPEEDFQASRAFCKAFDREAEEDEFDVIAAGSYHLDSADDAKPSRRLEVRAPRCQSPPPTSASQQYFAFNTAWGIQEPCQSTRHGRMLLPVNRS